MPHTKSPALSHTGMLSNYGIHITASSRGTTGLCLSNRTINTPHHYTYLYCVQSTSVPDKDWSRIRQISGLQVMTFTQYIAVTWSGD